MLSTPQTQSPITQLTYILLLTIICSFNTQFFTNKHKISTILLDKTPHIPMPYLDKQLRNYISTCNKTSKINQVRKSIKKIVESIGTVEHSRSIDNNHPANIMDGKKKTWTFYVIREMQLGNFVNGLVALLPNKNLKSLNINCNCLKNQSVLSLEVNKKVSKNFLLPRAKILIEIDKQSRQKDLTKEILDIKKTMIARYESLIQYDPRHSNVLSKIKLQVLNQENNIKRNEKISAIKSKLYNISLKESYLISEINVPNPWSYSTIIAGMKVRKSKNSLPKLLKIILNCCSFTLYHVTDNTEIKDQKLPTTKQWNGLLAVNLGSILKSGTDGIKKKVKENYALSCFHHKKRKDMVKLMAYKNYEKQCNTLSNHRRQIIKKLVEEESLYREKYHNTVTNTKEYGDFLLNLQQLIMGEIEQQYQLLQKKITLLMRMPDAQVIQVNQS